MTSARTVGLLCLALVAVACGTATPTAPPTPAPPSFAYSPGAVLQTYLDDFQDDDCTSARREWLNPQASVGDGDLCPDTVLMGFTIDPTPATVSAAEQELSATLTTTGTADRTVSPGNVTWFYDLKLQPNGTWLIVSAGSGP